MSYLDRCPDRWEAERQGRSDGERRYHDYGDRSSAPSRFGCDDAQSAYEDAYRSAQYRAEEERQEAEYRRAHEHQMAEERAMEEQAYHEAMEAQRYEEEMRSAEAEGHA